MSRRCTHKLAEIQGKVIDFSFLAKQREIRRNLVVTMPCKGVFNMQKSIQTVKKGTELLSANPRSESFQLHSKVNNVEELSIFACMSHI